MVISLLTPTDSAEPSVNTRCARSLAPVRTRSLENTSMPTRRMRSFWAGGVPRGSPLTAEATPTVCAMAGRVKPIRRKAIRSNRDMGDSLEPPAHAQQGVEGLESVVADRRGALEIGGLSDQGEALVERHRQQQAEIEVGLLARDRGIDRRVGRIIARDRAAGIGGQVPLAAVQPDRIGEAERQRAAIGQLGVAL